jgi:4-hydroxybenzoate-CoA ligase
MSDVRQYNAVADFVDRNVEAGFGQKTAFLDQDRSLTYQELQVETHRMANLLSGLETRRETRIAILMLDTVDWPVVFWGAVRAGVVPVCLNTLLTSEQYEYMLNDSRAEVLFVSAELLPVVSPVLSRLESLKHIVVVNGDDHGFHDFRTLIGQAGTTARTVPTSADETAFWLYSSGSTGAP